ncbi:MAG: hypothetical protein LBU75_03135 [Desulfovibrio sp.]|nr:hypothetical protein [Desulfovibrio sp.]
MQPNSISNNKKNGAVPDHLAIIAALLAELTSQNIDYGSIFARLEIHKKKPRGAAILGKFVGSKQCVLEFDK